MVLLWLALRILFRISEVEQEKKSPKGLSFLHSNRHCERRPCLLGSCVRRSCFFFSGETGHTGTLVFILLQTAVTGHNSRGLLCSGLKLRQSKRAGGLVVRGWCGCFYRWHAEFAPAGWTKQRARSRLPLPAQAWLHHPCCPSIDIPLVLQNRCTLTAQFGSGVLCIHKLPPSLPLQQST